MKTLALPFKKINLLYVNNNQFDTILVKTLVGKYVNLFVAEDIDNALNFFRDKTIDVVVIDEKVNHSSENKITLFEKIKFLKLIREEKIFVLTSLPNFKEIVPKEEWRHFFVKPLIAEDIIEIAEY